MKTIDELKNDKGELDHNAIKQVIPYEIPFLMFDKVLELKKDKIVAIKHVSANDPNLNGHFRGFPIMPGALIIEGMGQAGTLLVRYNLENHWEKEVLAYKIKDAKFKEPIFPGQTLKYEIALMGLEDRGGMLTAVASVDGKNVAECQMMLAVVDRKEFRAKHSKAYN